MKSFVEYPSDFKKMLFPENSEKNYSGKLIAHYELYRKISHLDGCIVKCGISAEDGFSRFATLKHLMSAQPEQKVVAFEKFSKTLFITNDSQATAGLAYQIKNQPTDINRIQQKLLQKGISDLIEFVPGNIGDSIPEYLISNPEMKISYLNIDFDDYDSTLTALQFFYPRLVHGGILIFDNYYKGEEDHKAVEDYFKYSDNMIYSFSVNKGPHYLTRE